MDVEHFNERSDSDTALEGITDAVSSIFQKGIDQYFKVTKLSLILMDSRVGMMEREVLFYTWQ